MSIAGYNCKIEYLAGMDNSVADLLSRVPNLTTNQTESLNNPDISRKTYEISVLNSNRFSLKEFARCRPELNDMVKKPTMNSTLNMVEEQEKGLGTRTSLLKIKDSLKNDTLSLSVAKKVIVLDNILYYISKTDTDQILRLYIPEHL